jgi:MFS family permease
MLTTLMGSSVFSLLAPFYPDMAEEEKGLSSTLVGMIMASLSVTYVITAYLIGKNISAIGRRKTLYTGIIIQAVSMIGFGCLAWINNKILFIILSFALRMLGGVASGMINVACYAMTSVKYPEQIQQKIGLIEASNGAGLFCGPLLGGLIYEFTWFFMPFFIFTGLSL